MPHGSKKLEDLLIFNDTSAELPWVTKMTTPNIIFHDQEPLTYDLYTKKDLVNYVMAKNLCVRALVDFVASLHLRSCIVEPFHAYDQVLLCHSEQNSLELNTYERNGFIGVYYWSHAVIARDWYRYAKLDPKLTVDFENITHDFLIYNRAWSGSREYRLTLTEMLADQELIPCCNMTFSEFDHNTHYTQHVFANTNFAISRDDLHLLYPANKHDANASADYNSKDYATTAIEVVLETLFDDLRNHLTEKTLRPIACGRPFILVATPGSLQYLKQYGFETFDGLIDETYDTVLDPQKRLMIIVSEMKRISCLPPGEKILLWSKLYAIAERNQKLFFSTEWHNQIVKEFKDNFDQGIKRLTVTGKHWFKIDQIAETDPELAALRASDLPGHRTLVEREQLENWIKQQNNQD
jgi:hypothetical protein